jgi:hypothetical protein
MMARENLNSDKLLIAHELLMTLIDNAEKFAFHDEDGNKTTSLTNMAKVSLMLADTLIKGTEPTPNNT